MVITPISNGIVIDHITAGKGMALYDILNLKDLGCAVAMIMNVDSKKMGKKDIIKIDKVFDINFDAVGYVDPGATINVISDGKLQKRSHLDLPETITGVIKCRNPRCISTTEQELPQVFRLTDRANRTYRCIYCENKAKNK